MSETETSNGVPPLSIVAVDDDPDFREYLHAVLDPEGHDLRHHARLRLGAP